MQTIKYSDAITMQHQFTKLHQHCLRFVDPLGESVGVCWTTLLVLRSSLLQNFSQNHSTLIHAARRHAAHLFTILRGAYLPLVLIHSCDLLQLTTSGRTAPERSSPVIWLESVVYCRLPYFTILYCTFHQVHILQAEVKQSFVLLLQYTQA